MGALVFCIMLSSTAYCMEKKKRRSKHLETQNFSTLVKNKFKFGNLTQQIQIIIDSTKIKNRGSLDVIWQQAFEKVLITGILHRIDNAFLVQIDVTDASKLLKKHYKPQIKAKAIRQIISGKMTSPFKPIQSPAPESTLVSTTFYGLAFITMGWFGKKLWDEQVKHYLFNVGTRAMHSILNELKVYN